jgi:hypothetical protein
MKKRNFESLKSGKFAAFDSVTMNETQMKQTTGGLALPQTSWRGSDGSSGSDSYDPSTDIVYYGDGCLGFDGVVHCP